MENKQLVGKVLYSFDELPSTNDWASEFIAKSAPPEGTLVRAAVQTAGRGQFGSTWQSAAGQNLLFSVVLYPVWLPLQQQFYLSMAVALALYDTAVQLDCQPPGLRKPWRVKWPNDLYWGNQKAAGILIQNGISAQTYQSAVVGIGLNVNQLEFDPSLPNPTSLALANGTGFNIESVFETLCHFLDKRYLQLKNGGRALIKADYEAALFRKDIPSSFENLHDHSTFQGTIRGVADNGQLLLESNGGLVSFDLKELRICL